MCAIKKKVENFTPTHLPRKMQNASTNLKTQKTPTKHSKEASMNNNKTQQKNANGHQGSKMYLRC
jgi:hypothetical protein